MQLEARILGCGSSGGVPRIGIDGPDWGACNPNDPRNRRSRCSLWVRAAGVTVLIDPSPDLRTQLIQHPPGRIDAVLVTHDHADQTHGIDDLRALAYAMRRRIRVYADRATHDTLKSRFGYCFETPAGSAYPPILDARLIPEPASDFVVEGEGGASLRVHAFAQDHGGVRSLGFRIGGLSYSSDVVGLGPEAFAALEGTACWIVDALRYTPHPTHAHVDKTLDWIRTVRPARAILTNLHIDLDFVELSARLPPGVEPAYDGLAIRVE